MTPGMAAIDVDPNRSWYPFQLAFILLNLPCITDPKHPDRTDENGAKADLLWLPTGGGKTEAYLGLAACRLGLRRLQGEVAQRPAEYGVAVLMRSVHAHAKKAISYQFTCAMTTVDFKFALVPADWVFDQTVVVIISNVAACYAVLESSIRKCWAYELGPGFGSSGGAPRDNPSRCFETFPFPDEQDKARLDGVAALGKSYMSYRERTMLSRQEGLTKTCSRFHDTNEKSEDIARLRALHVEMDQAVAAAYGWKDLDLGHGFQETKQGVRYTISESARRSVLDRLLALNHQRYAEEIKAGLHDKGKGKGKKLKNSSLGTASQADLLPGPQGDLFT